MPLRLYNKNGKVTAPLPRPAPPPTVSSSSFLIIAAAASSSAHCSPQRASPPHFICSSHFAALLQLSVPSLIFSETHLSSTYIIKALNFSFFAAQITFVRVCVQSYSFLISSDYERAEWREIMKEQQKKCKPPPEKTLTQHLIQIRTAGLFIY